MKKYILRLFDNEIDCLERALISNKMRYQREPADSGWRKAMKELVVKTEKKLERAKHFKEKFVNSNIQKK